MSKKTPKNFKLNVISPEKALDNLNLALFGDKMNTPKYVAITTIVNAFLCYFYQMIYGLGCPDTICEGVHYYRNSDYSTSQARWMLRYINALFGKNVVIPVINVLFYCVMIGISAYIICRLIGLTEKVPQILLTTMMVSFPVILHHFAFLYMALAFSFSFLMATAGCALVRTRKIPGFIIGTICFLMMMGSYQSYIGAISALATILLISDLLNEKKTGPALARFGLTAASGLLACIINMPFSRWMMNIHHVGSDGRVDSFSLSYMIENIGFSLRYSYVWFFSFFQNDVLSRNRFYTVIFAVMIVLFAACLVKIFREKEYLRACLLLVAFLLLPIAMNLLLIIMPGNGMRDILRYQYVLIFALVFILHKYLGGLTLNSIAKYLTYAAVVALFIGNVITANCTAMLYKFCYDHYEQQFLLAMERVYELDGYVENSTPIIIGGAPSYEVIEAHNQKIFRYAEKDGGPAFWWNPYGMTICREYYFKDFLGISPGYFSESQYQAVINCQEFKDMPLWPEEGSVKMIEGIAVIRFAQDPPQ